MRACNLPCKLQRYCNAGSSLLQLGVSLWRNRGPTSTRHRQLNLGKPRRRKISSKGRRVVPNRGNQRKHSATSAITVRLASLLNIAISGKRCEIFTLLTRALTHARMCHSTSMGPFNLGPSLMARPLIGPRAGRTCAGVAPVHINHARSLGLLHHLLLLLHHHLLTLPCSQHQHQHV